MPLLERTFRCVLPAFFAVALTAAPPLRTAFGPVPPLSYRTPEGRPAGFTIDVFNEAARREGMELQWVSAGPSLAIEASLRRGALDIVPAGMVTPDRSREFYVSAPWWFAELSLVRRGPGSPDSAGKRLALGSPIYRFLAEKVFPGAILVPFTDSFGAAEALCRGEADSALMVHMDVHEIFLGRHDLCAQSGVTVKETQATAELAILARRGMEEPARRLRERIDEMALDGTLARMAGRYPAIPSSGIVKLADDLRGRYSRRLWQTIAICALLLLVAGGWFIRRQFVQIRARKRAQAELRVSRARLARAHRIAALGDWEIDLGSGRVDLSAGLRELFNCAGSQDDRGWDVFLRRVSPGDVEHVRAAFERAAAGNPVDVFYAIDHAERGRRHVRQQAEPLKERGRVAKIVGTIQDLTEHRQLEDQLRESQKMESIGQLAGGVAHDFNNLLTVISGYSVMLLESMPPNDEFREPVGEIVQAAERAASLTRQLLTFSRRQVIQPKVISLNDVVRNLEKMLRRLIREDIDLVLLLDPRTPSILADAGQIEQVVMNLAVNARDAMPDGGKLTIQTSRRDAAGAKEGPHAVLAVTDTGAGIAPEIVPRIFEPFFTTKERGKGTGLGLSMVYGIVSQSGGSLEVRSQPGCGATFEVTLPAAERASSPDLVMAETEDELRGAETILVAEDESGVRMFIRETLRSHGYRVLEAANGREALEIARAHTGDIHLLLTDVIMPEMGGVELGERMRDVRPGAAILYMSGYIDRAAHAGLGETMLQKPFTPPVLLRRVRESLKASRARGPGPAGASGV